LTQAAVVKLAFGQQYHPRGMFFSQPTPFDFPQCAIRDFGVSPSGAKGKSPAGQASRQVPGDSRKEISAAKGLLSNSVLIEKCQVRRRAVAMRIASLPACRAKR
jgi:hypothetical protein